jgi:hypothetical protein
MKSGYEVTGMILLQAYLCTPYWEGSKLEHSLSNDAASTENIVGYLGVE